MKRFILTFLFAAIACVTVFCQVDDGGLKDALINIGIKPAYALILSILFTTVVLQVIPQKWAGVTHYLRNIFYGLYLLFQKLDDKLNNLTKKQKAVKALKKAAVMIALLFVVGSMHAQSPFSGFFQPSDKAYSVNALVSAGENTEAVKPVLLFRPYVAMTAQAYDVKDKTVGFLTGAGFGLSYGKYTTVDGKAWCNFAINASLLTQVKIGDVTDAKVGPAVSVGLLDNLFNVGVGYVDKSFLILFGVGYTF